MPGSRLSLSGSERGDDFDFDSSSNSKHSFTPKHSPAAAEAVQNSIMMGLVQNEETDSSSSDDECVWNTTSSGEESGADDEPAPKKCRTEGEIQHGAPQVLPPPAIPDPKSMSPRSFNRYLYNSVNLNEISDLSSLSSITSEDFGDLGGSPPRQIEFEVASRSPINLNPIEDSNSSSGLEDVELEQLLKSSDSEHWSENDEAENFADEESDSGDQSRKSSGLSTDSEISEKDKWYCTQCNVKTNNPYLRYCLRCFRIRRNWLPKRPKSRKSRPQKAKPEIKPHPNSLEDSSEDNEPPSTQEDPKSSLNHSFLSTSMESEKGELNLSDKLQFILDAPPLLVKKTVESGLESDKDFGICSICMVRDKNAAFVHGKIAHKYSCYTCADKILKKSGKCPICRKKILRVVKIIDV